MRAALELSERENAIDAETMAGMFAGDRRVPESRDRARPRASRWEAAQD